MKRKYLPLKFWITFMVAAFLGTSSGFGQATLMHSYTFEDGTANDVVGGAHGTVIGGTIADGAYTGAANGEYIQLPAAAIAINTYSAITLEGFIYSTVDNSGATMMAYFGGNENGVGGNGYFFTPDRWTESRTAISCGNVSEPWTAEQGVTGAPVTVGEKHYVVSILTNTSISWYIDGELVGTADVSGDNSIANLSTVNAWLAKGGYDADPTWMGTIHEFNIYEGVIDAATMAQHIGDFLGIAINDATLSDLSTDKGPVVPAFDPAVDLYEIYVPYGTTSLDINAVPTVEGATISMFDGLGNEIPADGVVTFGNEGIDVEIIVTALDGTTEKSYFLSIFLNSGVEVATLSSIDLSVGSFTTEFNPDSTSYTALVPKGTASVNVTGVPTWSGATVTGGGAIALSGGSATATLIVTSEDGTDTKEYTVEIFETKIAVGQDFYIVHEASGFVVGETGEQYNLIRLYNALRDDPTQLFQLEESGVTGQYFLKNGVNHYLTLVKNPIWDMIMTPTLTNDLDSCRFIIDEFEPGRVRILSVGRYSFDNKLMGPNGPDLGGGIYSDKWPDNTLAIWSIKPPEEVISPFDTDLSDLTINPGHLSPAFSQFITEYFVTLPAGTTSVTIAGVANDGTSTVTGGGTFDVSGGEGSLTITVTASDPAYTKDYVINYMVNTPLTLKHSYTFADGTAEDVEGDADGTVYGGSINEGVYSATLNGHYISLPGDQIAINTYPSITVEAYVVDDVNTTNDFNTMISYFGNTTGSFGTDYFFTSLKSRAAISCLNTATPWSAETGVTSANILDDGLPHHLVSVVNNDSITFYVDGVYAGAAMMSAANKIRNISNVYAYLCKSGYVNDLTWLGQILEFNIYTGEMDGTTIASRAFDYPIEDATTDATLSDLTVDGVTAQDFVSYNLSYNVILPKGTTTVPTIAGTTKNANASAVVTAATGLPGVSTIVVTAEDGVTVNTYTVNFSIEVSAEASLSDLTVDGTTIDGFDSGVTLYNVILTTGTTVVPTVVGTATDAAATVVVNAAASLPGATTVVVTAEDGITTVTYTVNFLFDVSTDATLSDLTVDGETVSGFAASVKAYNVVLPSGTTVVPTVDGTPTDPNATYVVNAATSLPGATSVVVTAEDGVTKITYFVNFTLNVSARDEAASAIKVYPTVSDGRFRVITAGGIHTISVFSVTGTLLTKTITYDTETEVNTPQEGMYLLRIENEEFVRTFRVIHRQ